VNILSSEMLREIREVEDKAQKEIDKIRKASDDAVLSARKNTQDQLDEAKTAAKEMVEKLEKLTKQKTGEDIRIIQEQNDKKIVELKKKIESKKAESINYFVQAVTKPE